MTVPGWTLEELFLEAPRRVLHLEMRDVYGGSPRFDAWLAGHPQDNSVYTKWTQTLAPLVAAGCDLRRARIVSEPVSQYVRFEHELTPLANLAAGERVRWVPRRRVSDLALPGNDFWLLDNKVLFLHFSGDGAIMERELVTDPSTARLCETAFEAAWSRGIDHDDYVPA